MSGGKGHWVLEYRHAHGTDIFLCEDETTAKINAIHLFLESWQEIEETQELLEKTSLLCAQVLAGNIDAAMSHLTDICVDDKYHYDESFFWGWHQVSDPEADIIDVKDAAEQAKQDILGILEKPNGEEGSK